MHRHIFSINCIVDRARLVSFSVYNTENGRLCAKYLTAITVYNYNNDHFINYPSAGDVPE